jgi:hypothetical protein
MHKIALESTIGGSYEFLFKRLGAILGTIWLPFLVFGALVAGIVYLAIPAGWWHGQFPVLPEKNADPALVLSIVQPILATIFPAFLLLLLMGAVTMVGLMRLAVGEQKSRFVYFSLGADVWRLIASYLLVIGVMILYYILAFAVGFTVAIFGTGFLGGTGTAILAVALVFGGIGFLIYAMVRLTFFIPAVVVAEHQIDLARSWELAGGNFWRIFVVYLAITIPVAVVAGTLQNIGLAFMPAGDILKMIQDPKPDFALVANTLVAMWPIMAAVQLIQMIATFGLKAGAVAHAYKTVTGEAAP